MKRIISLVLALMMVLCLFPTTVFAALRKPEEEQGYLNNYHDVDFVTPEEPAALTVNSVGGPLAAMAATPVPSSYSSVLNNQVMSVKNQGSDGTCWAFSATACVEAGLIASGATGVDLSTLQLVNFFYNDKIDPLGNATGDKTTSVGANCLDRGGNHLFTMWGLAGWTNGATETTLPYNNSNRTMAANGTLPETYANDYDIAHLQNAYILPYSTSSSNMQNIKRAIMEFGAVGCSYYHSNSYYNSSTGAYYCKLSSTNHAVTIVGWNDSYSRSNFKSGTRPGSDGAWLVKNSWGTNWGTDGDANPTHKGQQGYFWLSYYDSSLASSGNVFAFDFFSNTGDYQYNYQYDGSCGIRTKSLRASDDLSAMYVARNPNGRPEVLTGVGVGLYSTGVSGKAYIYTGCTMGKPKSGSLVATVPFSTNYAGYYTIPVEDGPVLEEGDVYSVVFDFDTSVTAFVDTTYQNGNWISFTADTTNDKTYVVSGSSVTDLARSGVTARVKAYTKDSDASATTYTVTYDANGGTGAPDPQTENKDVPLTLSEDIPTRTGYTFLGWSADKNAVTADYPAGGSYTGNKSVRLYAIWQEIHATGLTLDPAALVLDEGGTGKPVTVSFTPTDVICNLSVSGLGTSGITYTVDGNVITFTATKAVQSNPVVVTVTDDKSGKTADLSITVNNAPVKATSLSISPETLTLVAGGAGKDVTLTTAPSDAVVNWSVTGASEKGINVIPNGNTFTLTATQYQSSNVTVKFTDTRTGLNKSCTVTVEKPIATSFGISTENLALDVNKSATVTLTPTPADAGMDWSVSGQNSVVSVTQNGNSFTVKGLKAGSTTVRFTDSRSGLYKECTVTVTQPPKQMNVKANVTSKTSGLLWFKSTTYTATITATPTNTTVKTVQYSTNNGSSWKTGTSFTSSSNITSFLIRVTDADGDVYDYQYLDGKVTELKSIVKATSLVIAPTSLTMTVGDAARTVTVTPTPADAECKWSVSGASGAVTVTPTGSNSFTVAPQASGKVTLTFTDTNSNKSVTCPVTVNRRLADSLTPSTTEMTLVVGGAAKTLTVTPNPSYAECAWKVEAPTGIKVTPNGNSFSIQATAYSATPVTVKITDTNSNKSVTCTVTTQNAKATSIGIDKTSLSLNVGASGTVTLSCSPSNAVTDWEVSGTTSAVEVQQNGNTFTVLGKAAGNATLTFRDKNSGLTKTCTVTVSAKSIKVSAKVEKKTERYLLFFTRTVYTATITATPTGTTVKKVEYNTGSGWNTGTSFTSTSNITSFQIRVTDGDNVQTVYQYSNGTVSVRSNTGAVVTKRK